MTSFLRLLKWILRGVVFLVLLAFALNNLQEATVHLLFGRQWSGPLTLIVLAAFLIGVIVGVAGMLPAWWRRRRAQPAAPAAAAPPDAPARPDAPAPLAAPAAAPPSPPPYGT